MRDPEIPESGESSSIETIVSDLKSGDQIRIDAAIGRLELMDAGALSATCGLFLENLVFACYRKGPSKSANERPILKIVEKIGEPALAHLRKLMEKPGNYRLAILVCIILAKTDHPAAAPGARAKLGAFIEGPDEVVARYAIDAMVVIGDEYVVDYLRLVALKTNPSQSIRADCAKALGRIGDKRAIPDLEDALRDPSWSNVRPVAKWALFELNKNK